MRRTFTVLLFCFCAIIMFAASNEKRFTLVVDAGHGGHDTGACGAYSQEKDINLKVAMLFGQYVERNCPDVKVVYTRTTDVFIPLHERANIANRNKADLFVSVHTNAVASGHTTRGFQVYTLGMHRKKDNLDVAMRENSVISMEKDYKQTYHDFDPNSSESYIMFEFIQSANMEKSVELARLIQNSVCSSVGRLDKGVHQAGFLVLRETSMPSCLIELGFITTPEEEDFLNSSTGPDQMANAIYKAFVSYRKQFDKRATVPTNGSTVRVNPSATTAKQNVAPVKPISSDKKVTVASTTKPAPKTNTVASASSQKPQTKTNQSQPKTAQPQSKASQAQAKANQTQPKNTPSTAAKTQPAKTASATAQTSTPNTKPDAKQTAQNVSTQEAIKESIEGVVPTFKVQILAINRRLRPDSEQFKGHEGVDCYQDGNTFKYTIGSTTDYNEIVRIKKKLIKDFPESFVVAFNGTEKMNTSLAIAAYVQNKKNGK